MVNFKLPDKQSALRKILLVILTQCIAVMALVISFNAIVLDTGTYTAFMEQNRIYSQIQSAVANNIVAGLPEGARIAPLGDVVNRLSNYIPEDYVKIQTNNFVKETIGYLDSQAATYNPVIDIRLVKGKIAQAITESYIASRGLEITSPQQQKIIALQQDQIVKYIPEQVGKKEIMVNKNSAEAFSVFEQNLELGRGYFGSLKTISLAAGALATISAIGLFLTFKELYGFFKYIWKPLVMCGVGMILVSILLPMFAPNVIGNSSAAHSQDPQVNLAIASLMNTIFYQVGFRNALNGIIIIIAGLISYALGKYVFSPPAFDAK